MASITDREGLQGQQLISVQTPTDSQQLIMVTFGKA